MWQPQVGWECVCWHWAFDWNWFTHQPSLPSSSFCFRKWWNRNHFITSIWRLVCVYATPCCGCCPNCVCVFVRYQLTHFCKLLRLLTLPNPADKLIVCWPRKPRLTEGGERSKEGSRGLQTVRKQKQSSQICITRAARFSSSLVCSVVCHRETPLWLHQLSMSRSPLSSTSPHSLSVVPCCSANCCKDVKSPHKLDSQGAATAAASLVSIAVSGELH